MCMYIRHTYVIMNNLYYTFYYSQFLWIKKICQIISKQVLKKSFKDDIISVWHSRTGFFYLSCLWLFWIKGCIVLKVELPNFSWNGEFCNFPELHTTYIEHSNRDGSEYMLARCSLGVFDGFFHRYTCKYVWIYIFLFFY